MGLLGGDLIPWCRWWIPVDTVPTLSDGFLPDPVGKYSRYINRGMLRLNQCVSPRARVLLADPGMGKSTELRVEVERLLAEGEHASMIDLGTFASTAEIKAALHDEVRAWETSGTEGELWLLLDGFDEPLVDVNNLSEVLALSLSGVDKERLRVSIASRGSHWSQSLQRRFQDWWGAEAVLSLQLAPLTENDVAVAAESHGQDGQKFVAAVLAAGAGALAARPITLRLMLAGAHGQPVPTNRLDTYREGVGVLAVELGERRIERRRTGTSVERRLAAARNLAAASVLSGRPSIIRRASSSSAHGELALDEIDDHESGLAALDDVFDSALLTGGNAARAWCHHSVAEYLCGQALADIPATAALNLLASPGDPRIIKPQLEDTAVWIALMDGGMFNELVSTDPRILLKADVRSLPAVNRERLGRALLSQLNSGEVLLGTNPVGAIASAFDYAGADDDVRRLLDDSQPGWKQMEGVRLAAVLGHRVLDHELLSLVRKFAGQAGSDADVARAIAAAHALAGAESPEIIQEMKQLAGDTQIPPVVRSTLLCRMFPAQLSASHLAALVRPADRWIPVIGRPVVHAMQQMVEAKTLLAQDVLVWFGEPPLELIVIDEAAGRLAMQAALGAADAGPDGPQWQLAVQVIGWLLRDSYQALPWPPSNSGSLNEKHRCRLAWALLYGRNDPSMAEQLLDLGLLQTEDLLWWLDRLDDGARGEDDGGLSAESAVEVLAYHVIGDEEALNAARRRCGISAPLASRVGQQFSTSVVEQRQHMSAASERRRLDRQAEQASHRFTASRLEAAVAAGDLAAALDELEREPAPKDRPPGPNGPVTAWTTASPNAQHAVAKLAQDCLIGDRFSVDDFGDIHEMALCVEIIAAADRDKLAVVPAESWIRWLPALLRSARPMAAKICLTRVLSDKPALVASTLLALLDDEVRNRGGAFPSWVFESIPPDLTADLASHSLALAAQPDVTPSALSGLLAVGNAGAPAASARVALAYLAARGDPPEDGPRPYQDRAISAGRALVANPGPHDCFDGLFDAFQIEPQLAISVVRNLDPWQSAASWKALSPSQLADLYLWAKVVMPSPAREPGTTYSVDHAEELASNLIDKLVRHADEPAVQALQAISAQTGNVYLRNSANRLAAEVAAQSGAAPTPAAILAVLQNPVSRVVASASQLAQVVLAELDLIADDLAHDRGMRRRFWERQRAGTDWSGTWVPAEETRLSQELKAELAIRLRSRIAIVREVEIQPSLGTEGADLPDVVALAMTVTTDTSIIQLPIEIKGNYNSSLIKAFRTQLIERYMSGPIGIEGIYVVVFFPVVEGWDAADKNRRRTAKKYSAELLRDLLAEEAVNAHVATAHVRVIEIPLERGPFTTNPAPE